MRHKLQALVVLGFNILASLYIGVGIILSRAATAPGIVRSRTDWPSAVFGTAALLLIGGIFYLGIRGDRTAAFRIVPADDLRPFTLLAGLLLRRGEEAPADERPHRLLGGLPGVQRGAGNRRVPLVEGRPLFPVQDAQGNPLLPLER